ncbi:hypothetical protein [Fuerstiella marisgermanici]|uniref:hypothetical protein n=1 Tax=Fuerstiella marisgermanici TaxID=1891926 RepID=UPI0011AB63FB|nr:hypothetical protein [Fuerstiella marisgermanici]
MKQTGKKSSGQTAREVHDSPVLEAARQAIERLRMPVREKLEQIAAKVDGLRTQELPLEAAIKALKTPAKEPSKKRQKPSGSNVKQKDVIEACVKVLKEEHALKGAELEQKVRLYLKKDRGLSLLGYAMRFKEAMKTDVFAIIEDGVVVLSESVAVEENAAVAASASATVAN